VTELYAWPTSRFGTFKLISPDQTGGKQDDKKKGGFFMTERMLADVVGWTAEARKDSFYLFLIAIYE
jgi:hypothetical protein